MTTQTGALLTTGGSAVVGMREDLGDTVSRMDPGTTPAVSWFGTGTADNTTATARSIGVTHRPYRTPRQATSGWRPAWVLVI